jgi:peptide/nickel transport system ATP-binding protein
MHRARGEVRQATFADTEAPERVLTVENLSVDLHLPEGVLHAVQGVSLHVDRGETLCIVGESGCGKTLTALALMDLLPHRARRNADQLAFLGRDLLQLNEREIEDLRGDRIAMIFQDPMTSLNPSYTIGSQLEEVLRRHRRASARVARDRALEVCERVGVTPAPQRLAQYPHQLSGGLCQRVMIAMALMCEPAVVVADEPTTSLDVTLQAQILRLLADLQRDHRLAMILITHDLGIVAQVATRVMVMYAGQVVETATAERLFRGPRHPYTRGLLACLPASGTAAPGTHLGTLAGTVPTLFERRPGCAFASRCPLVIDACLTESLALRSLPQSGHAVRCLRAWDSAGPLDATGSSR